MPLVKIKQKYQVTLPASIRAQARLKIGDFLEAEVTGTHITLTPKSVVDRELALALDDVRKGRVHGPFDSAKEAIAFLHKGAKRKKQKTS